MKSLLDRLIATLLLGLIGTLFVPLTLVWKVRTRQGWNAESRRLLSFVSIDVATAEEAGVPVEKSDAGGFFDEVALVGLSERPHEGGRLRFSDRVWGKVWSWPSTGFHRTKRVLSMCKLISWARREVLDTGVCAIVAQEPFLRGPIALAAAALTGRLFVLHIIQNYDVSSRASQGTAFPPLRFLGADRLLEKYVIRMADMVIGGWDHYKDYALFKGARLDKTFSLRPLPAQVHWTEYSERQDLRAELGDLDRPVLLYVGRLHPVKYAADLVEMLRAVVDTHPRAVLWLVGSGPLEGSIRKRADELSLADNLRLLGHRTQMELVDVYATADVIVFTHGGTALAEAALAARPIVAYDHEWHPDFIGEDERGLLADFRDPQALAQKVNLLLKDPVLATRLGDAARAFAESAYDHAIFAKVQQRMYRKLLTGRVPFPR